MDGIKDPPDPAVLPTHLPGGDAFLWFVPCAERCGKHQQHCASPGTDAIFRTDPATER